MAAEGFCRRRYPAFYLNEGRFALIRQPFPTKDVNRGAMAGHSQFKNIMHRKGRQDSVRSKMFSKLAREITVAAKSGLPDPTMNASLRLAIQNAKAQSMPKDNIDRAIKKASGADTENYDAIRYEGYGPGGTAIIVEATYKPTVGDADKVMEAAIEAGADDVESDEEGHVIICGFESLGEVAKALEATLGEAETVKAIWRAQNNVPVDEEKAQSLLKLIDNLEDDDDVQNVYSNFEVSEEVLAKLSA